MAERGIPPKKIFNVYLPLACNKNLRGKTFDENLETLLSYKGKLSAKVLFPTAETEADVNTLIAIMNFWTIEAVEGVTRLLIQCKHRKINNKAVQEICAAVNISSGSFKRSS